MEETTTANSPILPKTRPLGEKKALHILNILLPWNIPGALEAGLISRWLSKYPFPSDPPRRQHLVILMKAWWSDDAVMSSIFSTLTSSSDAIKQLRKYGLMGSMLEENDQDDQGGEANDDSDEADSDVWMVDGEDTAGLYRQNSSRRPQEGSAEEQALRRRRREAMVISEGGRPFGRDDIIQRPMEDDGRV